MNFRPNIAEGFRKRSIDQAFLLHASGNDPAATCERPWNKGKDATMKRLLLTTALVIGASAASVAVVRAAEPAAGPAAVFRPVVAADSLAASRLIGMRVHVAQTVPVAAVPPVDGVPEEWNDVGEVREIYLSRDGRVQAVVLDIGGFLGMGERQLAVDISALRFVADASTPDDPTDFHILLAATPAMLKAAPLFDPETRQVRDPLAGTGLMRPGYVTLAHDEITADDLTGVEVFDVADESIGEVSQLILTTDGKLEKAVIDVGGFLGIGEKPVALPIDKIHILRRQDGDELRVYVDMTREALETLPAWSR
ncbi:MAG: PRC-barrel domain containing protein [Alphaproteobacteria bacterium]|nr:MAG: PRC-barrel domain containing protein [Alphaproteobacteria bacterium]